MKPMKVFYNGKRLKDVYPHATRFQVFKYRLGRFIRKIVILTVFALLIVTVFKVGSHYQVNTVYADKEVIVEVLKESPVLDRIAKCESGNKHYDSNGQVLVVGNNNKTVDVGRYQINEFYWGAKATELGLNLFDEEDNRTMAEWLYLNKGTEPWIHSKQCWNK